MLMPRLIFLFPCLYLMTPPSLLLSSSHLDSFDQCHRRNHTIATNTISTTILQSRPLSQVVLVYFQDDCVQHVPDHICVCYVLPVS